MGESRIIPTLHESGVHGWTWGQVLGLSESIRCCYPSLTRKPITMLQAPSVKPQASLTMDHGYCRMNIERKIMEEKQLKRIADILEEILKLIKKDMGVK